MKQRFTVVAFVVVSIFCMTGRASAADFAVTTAGMSAFVINGQSNPGLTLTRGHTYTFALNASGHPFWIKTAQETGTDSTFDTGVTNNGISSGTLTFAVPANAPSRLYYQCQFHETMTGVLTIVSASVPATTNATRGLLGVGLALLGFALVGDVRRRSCTLGARRSRRRALSAP
jgi:hypothetical protein